MSSIPTIGSVYSVEVAHHGILKSIILDTIPESLKTTLVKWWNTELPLEEACKNISHSIAENLPFLGYESYVEYASQTRAVIRERRAEFYSLFHKPQPLSKLIETEWCDCSVYSLATGNIFSWPVYHLGIETQEGVIPSRHTVIVPRKDATHTYFIDSSEGYNKLPIWFKYRRDLFEKKYIPVELENK